MGATSVLGVASQLPLKLGGGSTNSQTQCKGARAEGVFGTCGKADGTPRLGPGSFKRLPLTADPDRGTEDGWPEEEEIGATRRNGIEN